MIRRKTVHIAQAAVVIGWFSLAAGACSSEPAAKVNPGGASGTVDEGVSGGGREGPPTTGGAAGAKGGETSAGHETAGESAGSANATGGSPDSTRAGNGGSSALAGGAPESAGSSGQSGCAGRELLLCEDFETTELGGVPSGWTRHGELATVGDDEVHGGSRALRLGPAASAERRIYHDAKLLGSAHWGRIYFKVQTPVPDAFVHSTLVSLIGDGPKNGRSDYRPIDTVKQAKDTKDVGGRHNYIYNVQVIGKQEFGTETSYDFTFDANWHCAEYHIDASNQSYTLYLDGKDVLHFAHGAGNYDGSDIPSQFEELRVGWINYQSAPPGFTAFIDDIAFDDARIGCD
ncbi:MAG TPA: hypothetical protein VER11_32540 [Polyangiaceae bacterium]|nr:hypothetical protein [Polyangiaceae bacterium]